MSQPEFLYVEKPAIDQFQKSGWSYLDGRELNPDKTDPVSQERIILRASCPMELMLILNW